MRQETLNLCLKYINHFQLNNSPASTMSKIYQVVIEALVEIKNFEFLYEKIKPTVSPVNSFYQELVPFILNKKITYFPPNLFHEIHQYLQPDVAQTLLLNLNTDGAVFNRR